METMAPADWMKSEAWLANVGHLMAGALVALITRLFTHAPETIAIVESFFVLYVILKEFWFDLTYESGEDIGSSALDAAGYVAGNLVGWGLIALANHVN